MTLKHTDKSFNPYMSHQSQDTLELQTPGNLFENTTKGLDYDNLWKNTSKGVHTAKNQRPTYINLKHPYNVLTPLWKKAHSNMSLWT